MIQSRLARLAQQLSKTEFAGIALNAGPSLTYFTGLDFHLMERPVVFIYLPEKEPILILPRMEEAKIAGIKEEIRSFVYDENPDGWGEVFSEAFKYANVGKETIGVEPLGLRLLEYNFLQKAAQSAQFADGSAIIASLRCVKDEAEISCMQKAVDIAQNALQAVVPLIKKGMEEKELANELVMQLLRQGSDSTLPFSPIVSSGPNGANPHAKPSRRRLVEGDLLVIDWGASYGGYVSDLTRTFAVGEVDEESKKIHQLVKEANAAGRAAGKVGIACAEVDRAARIVIENAGYGKFFTHRTGHGFGKECHEEPYIRDDNGVLLQAGTTYTVEPGIYLPGKNGVRIEDDVLVTADGPISLSNLSRELDQVG
jgi:Xaa-Pro dipeptidase